MTTPTLSKIYDNGLLWQTEDYSLYTADGGTGYALVNRNTQATEGYVDQEPPAVMTLLMLQEAYDETMGDPEREFKVRKQQRAAHVPAGKAGILAN